MINTIQRKNSFRLTQLLIVVVLFFCLSAEACALPKRSVAMKVNEMSLWSLLDDFHKKQPLNKAVMENLTNTVLIERRRNEYFAFLEGVPNLMSENPGMGFIERTSFSYRLSNPSDYGLTLYVDQKKICVSLETVRSRFRDGEILPPPSQPPLTPGQPLVDNPIFNMIGWAVSTAKSDLVFTFHPEDKSGTGCLAKVSLGVKKP